MEDRERIERLVKRLKDLENDLDQIILLGNDVEDLAVNLNKLLL